MKMKIVVGNSRWRYVVLLLGSLAFVVAGIFILVMEHPNRHHSSDDRMAGWAGIVFFGGCALVAVWQLVDSRPRLIIDEEGILDRTLGVGLIPWTEIQGAYLQSIYRNHFICLHLRNAERYLQHTTAIKRALASTNTALGFTPISLNLSGVAVDANDVLELILKRIQAPNSLPNTTMAADPKHTLIIWRESVCAGDDCDAPHELVLPSRDGSLRSVVTHLLGTHYLASISSGRATWILEAGRRENRPLAVLAQQWSEPRFLVDADAAVTAYVEANALPHLNLRYWCQVDPAQVFDCLRSGEPLPDRYGR